eukprot:COSAG02_NODE_7848_length_2820_cov_3.458287_4_plen_87_part_00
MIVVVGPLDGEWIVDLVVVRSTSGAGTLVHETRQRHFKSDMCVKLLVAHSCASNDPLVVFYRPAAAANATSTPRPTCMVQNPTVAF